MNSVDLESLPSPEAVKELSFASIRDEWEASLTSIDADLASSLVPGDIGTELIQTGAYRDLYVTARTNDEARQRFLALAYGVGLDELGRVLNTTRGALEDGDYRTLIHTAERVKGTGSRARYEREALGAHFAVFHAHAIMVGPAVVSVYWTPTEESDLAERLAAQFAVITRLNGSDAEGFEVRMLTDELTAVLQAAQSGYVLTAHLHLEPGPDPGEVLGRAQAAAEALAYGTHRGAGVPVPRSEIFSALQVTGVAQVDLASPAADLPYIADTFYQADSINITHEVASWLL